ncbi:MAG: hypothetical protein JMN26_18010, partial [gamma proteobacterium endosymbiont of Lamellibrachia anaximandri]|nr:hypothetical protein [gamma proteobacterium endosymbiont of Lamellibrachia anaximandri]
SPLAQGTPGKQCGLAATGDYQPSLRSPWLAANVDGGAISIGHPVGASGARLVLHLVKTLHQNNAQTGVASLCIGGGQGGAMLVEAVK